MAVKSRQSFSIQDYSLKNVLCGPKQHLQCRRYYGALRYRGIHLRHLEPSGAPTATKEELPTLHLGRER